MIDTAKNAHTTGFGNCGNNIAAMGKSEHSGNSIPSMSQILLFMRLLLSFSVISMIRSSAAICVPALAATSLDRTINLCQYFMLHLHGFEHRQLIALGNSRTPPRPESRATDHASGATTVPPPPDIFHRAERRSDPLRSAIGAWQCEMQGADDAR